MVSAKNVYLQVFALQHVMNFYVKNVLMGPVYLHVMIYYVNNVQMEFVDQCVVHVIFV